MKKETIPTRELRDNLTDRIQMARYGNTVTVVTKHGKPRAAIISLKMLEKLETLLDAEADAQ